MFKLSNILKNSILLLLLLYIAPMLIHAIKEQYHALLDQKTKVGVISISGPLCEAQPYIQAASAAFKNPELKALVLRIDCEGGSSGAAQALFTELSVLKKEHSKKIIAYVENIAASGGYYVAAAADAIVATPSALIGNIGVYIQQPQLKEFIEQYKIQYAVTQTGTYKTVGNMFLDQTEQGKRMLQKLTDEIYQQFITDIAHARPQLRIEAAAEWADGKTVTGAHAVSLGLIDATGSPTTVENLLRKMAPLDDEIEWVYVHGKQSVLENLFGSEQNNNSLARSILTTCIRFAQTIMQLPR